MRIPRINRINLNGYPDWYLASWVVVGAVWLGNHLWTEHTIRKAVKEDPDLARDLENLTNV